MRFFYFLAILNYIVNLHAGGTPMTYSSSNSEIAVLGGGCFWCMEAEYKTVPGIRRITSGFAGGKTVNPSYEDVCTGATGHAEVIQIEFDPAKISYERILELFWLAHDPTTLNSQGNDYGTQYRSIILYENEVQKAAAEKSKRAAAKSFKTPIVTEIVPLTAFYPAEGYHQDYYAKHPDVGYSESVIAPKVEKFVKVSEKLQK